MENKRKNVYITIFVITTILASCLAVYFYLESGKENNTQLETRDLQANDKKVAELEAQITDLKADKLDKTDAKTTIGFVPFDASKGKNVDDGIKYSIYTQDFKNIYLNFLNGEPTITVTPNSAGDLGELEMLVGEIITNLKVKINQECKITGLSQKVQYARIFGQGQALGNEVVVFIMEDGTCEYAKLSYLLKNLSSQGKIEGLSNIVRIEQANAGGENAGGWVTPIAIDKDGNFYDIGNIIK